MVKRVNVDFYTWSSFQYDTYTGSYYLLLEYGDYKKFIEKHNISGKSDTHLMLLGVIDGLKMMKKPAKITVYSSALVGFSNIYKNDGTLRNEVKCKFNQEEKTVIQQLILKGNHIMKNEYFEYTKQKLMDEKILYS